MTTEIEGKDKLIKVVVEKLKSKKGDDSQKEETFETYVTSDYKLDELWRTLEEDYEYFSPDRLKHIKDGRFRDRFETKSAFHPYTEFEIVGNKAAADETHIYIDEPLQASTSRDQGVKFDVHYSDRGEASLNIDDALELVFHRTVRMPDDDRLHSLPASVGTFPLYNTDDYADRLPKHILEKGGLFLPMWQREALWIELSQAMRSPVAEIIPRNYAIRVYVGQINAITGNNMMEERGNQCEQDYLVFPGQDWIDGICVAPGVVRQFVAMPLGSDYTIEGQKTGDEKHGGLQIEIIPRYRPSAKKWLTATEEEALRNPYIYLDESKTPAELGLEPSAKVRLYPSPPTYNKSVEVGDLFIEKDDSCIGVTYLEAFYYDSWNTLRRSTPNSYTLFQKSGLLRHACSSMSTPGSESQRIYQRSLKYQIPPPPTLAQAGMLDPDYFDCVDAYQSSLMATRTASPSKLPDSKLANPAPKALKVKAMGLAAGGKLVQDIVADRDPPKIWNVDAARLINIHILDPASCESVTHIVPPPIPISAYEAVKAELPFFVVEEQIDNRLEGGDFDNVKSVSKMDETKGISSEPSLDPNQPTMCSSCEKRLCDCVVRPCDHQFCNTCIRAVELAIESSGSSVMCCPRCKEEISRVAGFSAPMNLPGEESIRTKVPVRILKVDDGRVKFQSIRQTRV